MAAKLAYYLVILPISYLPLRILYLFSDSLFLLLISVIPYRNKVIEANLRKSFPEKSTLELKRLKRKFYRHFCDLLAEGIKNLTISEKKLKKRFTVKNPELLEDLYKKNKSVLLVSGHYNNWEWLITAQNFLFSHQAMGIGMPMTSKFWDRKINERRTRFGMKVMHAKNFKAEIKANLHTPIAILTLADQSPGNSRKSYWMNFLNQKTAVLFGAEQMAHEFDFSVVFFILHKVKRGQYQMELKMISEEPRECNWGEITEQHVQLLEQEINKNPSFWLWSHNRWKREIPHDLLQLKDEQHVKFNRTFKNK
jgi:KDO2-lipid IV(A) lauroyltransferase